MSDYYDDPISYGDVGGVDYGSSAGTDYTSLLSDSLNSIFGGTDGANMFSSDMTLLSDGSAPKWENLFMTPPANDAPAFNNADAGGNTGLLYSPSPADQNYDPGAPPENYMKPFDDQAYTPPDVALPDIGKINSNWLEKLSTKDGIAILGLVFSAGGGILSFLNNKETGARADKAAALAQSNHVEDKRVIADNNKITQDHWDKEYAAAQAERAAAQAERDSAKADRAQARIDLLEYQKKQMDFNYASLAARTASNTPVHTGGAATIKAGF